MVRLIAGALMVCGGMLVIVLGLAVAQSSPPSQTCEQQLRDTQVRVQIVAQDRDLAQINWARLVSEVERLTQENAQLKREADEHKAPAAPATN